MPSAPVFLGLDLGTSGAKAAAYRSDGTVVAEAVVEVAVDAPAPDRSEQDPDVLLDALTGAVARVTHAVRRHGSRIAAIGCSGAMHSLLAVDAAGRPLTPAVIWADNRATRQVGQVRAAYRAAGLAARTGTPLHPMSPLVKLRWFAEEEPALAARAARWVSVKEYLVERLCGEWVVDHSVAAASGLFDLAARDWNPAALALARVDRGQLSAPVPTTTVLRGLDPGWAGRWGVDPATPFVIGASDGCLANLGAGAVDPGVAALTIGTSGAVRSVVDRPGGDPEGRLFCYPLTEDRWVVGGPVNNGGIVLRWARDSLLAALADAARDDGVAPYQRFDELAARVRPGAEGLLVLPYLAGERAPLWDPSLRGVVFGLQRHHGPEHLLRALLEGVAFALAGVVQAMADLGHDPVRIRASGGFTASALWQQVVADVLDRDLDVPRSAEGSVFGAALLAMQALGEGDALALARKAAVVERTFRPDPAAAAVYRRLAPLVTRVRDHLLEDFHALADLAGSADPDA